MIFQSPMSRRLKSLNDRREQLKAGIAAPTTKRRSLVTKSNQSTNWMRNTLQSMQVLQDGQLKQAQVKLSQCGIRSKDTAIGVIFAQLLLPIVIGGGVFLAIYAFGWLGEWGAFKRFGVAAGALILSYKAPDIWMNNMIGKRTAAIRKGIPDALDLLVICAEAGLSVDASFSRVAKELGRAYPELEDEFTLTAIELGFLGERRLAFENLAKRVPIDALKGVVTTMIQTEKYGTPLSSALRVLSAEFRHTRMMKAEEKAARLPALMSVPLIGCILPTLFIVIIGPAACSIADVFSKKPG